MTKHQSEQDRRGQPRAARSVFIDKGYLAARVEDVAKRAGLSKGQVFIFPQRESYLSLVREEQENTYYFLTRQKRTVGCAN